MICSKENCTGCGACATVCTHHAISFELDELGFRYPVIDDQKCVECNLCRQKCPALNPVEFHSKNDCYLAWSKDDNVHFDSASGGIGFELGRMVIQQGGVVAGCVWDNSFNAVFKLIDNVEDLKSTIGSKYVQSYISMELMSQIKEAQKNRKVLFIGLPCQCAAVARIGMGGGKNLITTDLLCHGGCSPLCLKTHVAHIQKKNEISTITDIKFRGGEHNCRFTLWNNNELVYNSPMFIDTYFYSFMKHSLLQESCYHCQYAQSNRISDLTIADFWGIDEAFLKDKNVLNGHNLLLAHTEKGESLLNAIRENIELYKRPYEEAVGGNDTLKAPTKKPTDRNEDIRRIKLYGFEKAIKKDKKYKYYIKQRRKGRLLGLLRKLCPGFLIKIVKSLRR